MLLETRARNFNDPFSMILIADVRRALHLFLPSADFIHRCRHETRTLSLGNELKGAEVRHVIILTS